MGRISLLLTFFEIAWTAHRSTRFLFSFLSQWVGEDEKCILNVEKYVKTNAKQKSIPTLSFFRLLRIKTSRNGSKLCF